MKGIDFDEFQGRASEEGTEQVTGRAGRGGDGFFSAVGNHKPAVLHAMLEELGRLRYQNVPQLLQAYGRFLLAHFAAADAGHYAANLLETSIGHRDRRLQAARVVVRSAPRHRPPSR